MISSVDMAVNEKEQFEKMLEADRRKLELPLPSGVDHVDGAPDMEARPRRDPEQRHVHVVGAGDS
jgi:hypothetical protein